MKACISVNEKYDSRVEMQPLIFIHVHTAHDCSTSNFASIVADYDSIINYHKEKVNSPLPEASVLPFFSTF